MGQSRHEILLSLPERKRRLEALLRDLNTVEDLNKDLKQEYQRQLDYVLGELAKEADVRKAFNDKLAEERRIKTLVQMPVAEEPEQPEQMVGEN